jgi:hypothetical protein
MVKIVGTIFAVPTELEKILCCLSLCFYSISDDYWDEKQPSSDEDVQVQEQLSNITEEEKEEDHQTGGAGTAFDDSTMIEDLFYTGRGLIFLAIDGGRYLKKKWKKFKQRRTLPQLDGAE